MIDASALGAKFGDDDLAAVKPLSEQIVIADLSGTAITDRSAPLLAAMKHARVLRLTNTKIYGCYRVGPGRPGSIGVLDLYGTAVTPACLKVVESLPNYDISTPEQQKFQLTFRARRDERQTSLRRLRKNSAPGKKATAQGLKPVVFSTFTARLKSCPDTKH